jgi:hypothetical protein
MDMGRIHNHKEVKFMKKFNFSKGLLIGLLTLALCFTCFGVVKASAEETTPTAPNAVDGVTYDALTDGLKNTTGSKVFVYVVKGASGNKIKAGAAAAGSLANGKTVALADFGVKEGKKDVYLYICDKEFEVEGNVSANLVIKAPTAKKITGKIDYTKEDATDPTKDPYYTILSASVLDANKKEITDPAPVIIWSKDAQGTYAYATDTTSDDGKKKSFNNKTLKSMLESGGTIYIKHLGVDGGTGDAVRTSKAVKVKIPAQGKEIKVKLDVAKGTLSLKNGNDFGLATKSGSKYTVSTWYTILPVLKTAATNTADDSIVATTSYKPAGKKDDGANAAIGDGVTTVSYTKYKFKAITLEMVADKIKTDAADFDTVDEVLAKGFSLGVRKSATDKKPASAVTYVTVAKRTDAPLIHTESDVKEQYVVSSGDLSKGIFSGKIENNPGHLTPANEGDTPKDATSGYWTTFKTVASTAKDNDTNPTAYEFCVVKAENLDATEAVSPTEDQKPLIIDWSTVSWKKFDPGKTKITAKTSSKYSTVAGSKVTATLTVASVPEGIDDLTVKANIPHLSTTEDDNPTTYILIRRAGVKGKAVDDCVPASKYVALYVAKMGSVSYLISTKDWGEEAYKYTINFAKYVDVSENGTPEYKFKVTDDIPAIVGWAKKDLVFDGGSGTDHTKAIDLPAFSTGFYFLKGGAAVDAEKIPAAPSALDDSVKKDIDGAAFADNTRKKLTFTMGQSAAVITVIAREYANAKVVAHFEVGDDDDPIKDVTLLEYASGVNKLATEEADKKTKHYVDEAETSLPAISGKIPSNYTKDPATYTAVSDIDGAEGHLSAPADGGVYKYTVVSAAQTTISIPVQVKQKTVKVTLNAGDGKFDTDLGDWEVANDQKTATQTLLVKLTGTGENEKLQLKVTLPSPGKAVKTVNVVAEGVEGQPGYVAAHTEEVKATGWSDSRSSGTWDIENTNAITVTVTYPTN